MYIRKPMYDCVHIIHTCAEVCGNTIRHANGNPCQGKASKTPLDQHETVGLNPTVDPKLLTP